jgi:hypothetical protein
MNVQALVGSSSKGLEARICASLSMYKEGVGKNGLYCHSLTLCKTAVHSRYTPRNVFGEPWLAFPMAKVLEDILEDLYDIVSTQRIQGCICMARARFSSVRCAWDGDRLSVLAESLVR